MKINKMTSYAFQIMKRMHMESKTIVTSKYIADKERLSQGITMKILYILRNEGIVASHQGRGEISGGFSLERDMRNLSVYELLTIMEGEFYLCPISKEEAYDRHNASICQKFEYINNKIADELKKHSMFDLFESDTLIADKL